MNGEPSYSTKEAPTASADTNQFHIIQPVYRDDVNTLQSLTQKRFNLHINIEYLNNRPQVSTYDLYADKPCRMLVEQEKNL